MKHRCLLTIAAGVIVFACDSQEVPMNRSQYPTVDERELQGIARTRLDSPTPTAAQLARREQSLATLKQLGLPHLPSLPVVEDEAAVEPRTAEEIAHRCLAVLVCAVKGETNDQAFVDELAADFALTDHFSPNEQQFLRDPSPSQQQLVDYSWQYEVVHVLFWALGYLPELAPPNEQADVSAMVHLVRDRDAQRLIVNPKPRQMSEILDMADLYYHLHWSAIELRLNGSTNDAVHEGIVRERHRALNWLIRYLGQEWDDVTTDT